MIDTLLRIRIFVAVYEERSFTAAAVRENATQSGITQHVQRLESFLGLKLFLRGTGTGIVTPTPAADVYYHACVRLLREHEQSRLAMQPYGDSLEGQIVIGLTPTTTRAAFGPTLARFVIEHPNVLVKVIDAYSDIILEKVRLGELDFGIIPGSQSASGMRAQHFASTPEFLVSGHQSGLGLTHGQPVRLADLPPLHIVLPSGAQLRRDHLEQYFTRVGASIARRLEIDSSPGQFDFVARTNWVSIHPGIMLMSDWHKDGLIINPLIEPTLTMDLFRVERARQHPTQAALAFLGVLYEETEALAEQARQIVDASGSPLFSPDARHDMPA